MSETLTTDAFGVGNGSSSQRDRKRKMSKQRFEGETKRVKAIVHCDANMHSWLSDDEDHGSSDKERSVLREGDAAPKSKLQSAKNNQKNHQSPTGSLYSSVQ